MITLTRRVVIAGILIALGCVMIGLGVGFLIGQSTDSEPCRSAVMLLDSQDLLDPGNADVRKEYLTAHDRCVRDNPA